MYLGMVSKLNDFLYVSSWSLCVGFPLSMNREQRLMDRPIRNKGLQAIQVIHSSIPLVIRNCIPLVIYNCIPLVIRNCIPLVIYNCIPLVIQFFLLNNKNIWIF
ncbi:hypothetical protein BDA99DRAFT_216122 [Phascolomyces articulosus]|uniref:Uncharacterized protein n=1 Tax=Phascolomyces articulosus TaxID=60185 RepID=A0AAD5JR71_9FUNG|nr:hypothetical protein BDA99DRAFT_216122 [Phascolomyces articulosus]